MNKKILYFHVFKVNKYYFGLLWTNKGLISSTISINSNSILKYFYSGFPTQEFLYKKSFFKCKNIILDYFKGKPVSFNFPIDYSFSSIWQSKVFRVVKNIPYGKCLSYKDIAILVKKPYSYRAVGLALKYNRILLIVPCHRVINHNCKICGFSKGLKLKKYLLSLEKII